MKRCAALLLLLALTMYALPVLAEDGAFTITGQVHGDSPLLDITIRDTGERLPEEERENVLSVTIEAQDGSISQVLRYQSSESPIHERAAGFVHLEDMNFDGCRDLVLLTAAGARNVFWSVVLWDEAAQAFSPVMQGPFWEGRELLPGNWSQRQLELCNYILYPETKSVYSCVADGYSCNQAIVWAWEGRSLAVQSVAEIYDAGPDRIGESLTLYGTDILPLWDEVYPESWYYGKEGVFDERWRVLHAVMRERALTAPTYLTVANVDWVHLRRQDSKASPSLAKLPRGTEVLLLEAGIGEDAGWVRVQVDPVGAGLYAPQAGETVTGWTGYIWHRYLTPDVQP